MSEYLQKFEELSAPLPEIAEDVFEGTFTNGLDPIIRKEVFSMRVVGLEDLMEAAQLAEEKIEVARGGPHPYPKEATKTNPKLSQKNYESPTTKMVTLRRKFSSIRQIQTHFYLIPWEGEADANIPFDGGPTLNYRRGRRKVYAIGVTNRSAKATAARTRSFIYLW